MLALEKLDKKTKGAWILTWSKYTEVQKLSSEVTVTNFILQEIL